MESQVLGVRIKPLTSQGQRGERHGLHLQSPKNLPSLPAMVPFAHKDFWTLRYKAIEALKHI